MEFLSDYGLFFLKIFTLVMALLLFVAGMIALASKDKLKKEKLTVKKLNDKFEEMANLLNENILAKSELRQQKKTKKQERKQREKEESVHARKKVFLIDFCGDMKASQVQSLREEVTAILSVATPRDEVIIRLESPGGIASYYGLAASQLQRIRDKNIPLLVCVDKVAASGGYMMACVADRIFAAPFAIIGSVGVVAQLPNFNRLLKKNNIDFELVTAGEYKRTLTLFGENTDQARTKMKEQMEEVLKQFKEFINVNRPKVNTDQIATGEYWLAKKAMEYRLVDELITSDDYLLEISKNSDIYQVCYQPKKSLAERLAAATQIFFNKTKETVLSDEYL
ncbi:MAG: protease SohB [Proteobacteria bacterium]|nr:protease SohB [Pseudomonadota bacterium]